MGEALLYDLSYLHANSDNDPNSIVPCTITYTGQYWEEYFLPATIPLLLDNGNHGIAAGLVQTFQPFNYTSFITGYMFILFGNSVIRVGFPAKQAV